MVLVRSLVAVAAAIGLVCFHAKAQESADRALQSPPRNAVVDNKPQQTAVDNNEVEAFAAALAEVHHVRKKWVSTIRTALIEGRDVRAHAREAVAEMAEALERNGLSIEKYNQIAELAINDPELQRRVEDRLPADLLEDVADDDASDDPRKSDL